MTCTVTVQLSVLTSIRLYAIRVRLGVNYIRHVSTPHSTRQNTPQQCSAMTRMCIFHRMDTNATCTSNAYTHVLRIQCAVSHSTDK